ncbi:MULTISPECIES: hypothetical protein [Mycobacteriaceae]|uniref:Ig-like domain-containing protein n=1 Tax=Mycobacteroides franklinii TaxID=948102 RepID=A0A4R5PDW1_9MYCO|nr:MULTISPECIES: hypothetical protein [Mycobacteriaceae]ORA60872.1 hypothetical protein BST24_11855 [Mycobacteroides franklinii]TDH23604.1 hypothetical protein EJ571_04840 [Mycobacteroides franklinii]
MHNKRFHRRAGIATAAAAIFVAASALGLSGAALAQAGPGSPDALQVILMLQRQGDKVIVNRTGNKPLHMCTVTSVREGTSEYWWTHPQVVGPNRATRAHGVGTQLLYRTMYVDVQC